MQYPKINRNQKDLVKNITKARKLTLLLILKKYNPNKKKGSIRLKPNDLNKRALLK
jgi:hypothetical protein